MNQLLSRQHLSSHPQVSRQVGQDSIVLLHTIRVKVKVALLGAVALLVAAIISSCGGTGGSASTPTPILSPTSTLAASLTTTAAPSPTSSPTPTPTPTPLPSPSPSPTPPPLPSPSPTPSPITPIPIFVGNLASGYGMGVNTSGGLTHWLTVKNGEICMAYPSGQSWGAVFITVGQPIQPPRPGKDFSKYTRLSLELQGQSGGESVLIGIKDKNQPDDGSETRVPVSGLTKNWKPVAFSLSQFTGANLHELYVVIEFVFAGTTQETVCARNIQYLP